MGRERSWDTRLGRIHQMIRVNTLALSNPGDLNGENLIRLLDINRRPCRNGQLQVIRDAFKETSLALANFVYPLFIHEGKSNSRFFFYVLRFVDFSYILFFLIFGIEGEEDTPIGAMPGCYRFGWRYGLLEEVAKARDVGVNSIVLFPKVPDALKTPTGDEAYNDSGLVPRTIRLLKDKYPDLVIYTDVALDPYSSDGDNGIVREDGTQVPFMDPLEKLWTRIHVLETRKRIK
ncbi:delta-aminolevulinic acid dehydratase, chloroplastic-like [Rutidosis leptorrhynchoides]|uniref:delta-aminolevulinic acid dehydratase, chloroplastic-like n=1 Tax=Rutidosis leptorrhynchoides TaxID=125765 RepID=UPI003A99B989